MTGSEPTPEIAWSSHRLGAALDVVRDGIVVLDPRDVVAVANVAAVERLGRNRDEVLGRSLYDLVPGLRDTRVPDHLATVRQGAGSVVLDEYVEVLGGWFEITADQLGEDIIVSVREVTNQRRLQLAHEVLGRIDRAVSAAPTMTEAVGEVARVLRTSIRCDVVEVWMHRERHGDLRRMTLDHDPERDDLREFAASTTTRLDGDVAPPVRAALAGEVVITTDVNDDPTFVRSAEAAAAGLLWALHLGVPLAPGLTLVIGLLGADRTELEGRATVLGDLRDQLATLLSRRRAQLELEQFFELAHEFVAITGRRGGFRRVNPAMVNALGFTEEELLRTGFGSLIHPDDVQRSDDAISAIVHTGIPADGYENRIRTASGRYRWVSWNAQVVAEEGVVFSTGRDVTDERAERLQQVHQNEVLSALVMGESLPTVLERVVAMLEAQEPSLTCSIEIADGLRGVERESGDVEVWRIPIVSDDEVLGTFVVMGSEPVEVTDRQRALVDGAVQLAAVAIQRSRAEAAARSSEERFRLVSEVVTEAIWDWDIDADTRWRSEGFFELFGYDPMELDMTDSWWIDNVHPDERERVRSSRQEALDGDGDRWTASYRFRCSDGRYADVISRARIVRDAGGRPIRMVGGLTDQSERLQLERQYLRAQRVESLGTLAGGIAHDLNNSLMPISMAVELLQDAGLDDDAVDLLDVITVSAQRSTEMVRSILAFARGLDGETEVLELAQVIEQSARLIRDTFPKNIDVSVDLGTDGVQIRGDVTQLHQVVMNLALNARDAMPDGGQLRIGVDVVVLEQGDVAAIRADPSGGMAEIPAGRYARVRVSDTGSGMSSSIRDRLFEPFFTTKTRTEGTGLGLPTSLAIARGHGGGIAVTVHDRGVTFDVYLAAEPDLVVNESARARREHGRVDGEDAGEGSMVLVVDDEPVMRAVIRDVLQSSGYRVVEAASGAEALRLADQHRHELAVVLTDIMMPVMDGVEFVALLAEAVPTLPVVAMTGLGEVQRSGSLVSNGVHAVLHKPFDRDVLLDTLATARNRT